jgi:hypothetical protein
MTKFLWTAEKHERVALALYKAAQDKKISPHERLDLRMLAKRTRIVARIVRKYETAESTSGGGQTDCLVTADPTPYRNS